jgi:hypothetical protein
MPLRPLQLYYLEVADLMQSGELGARKFTGDCGRAEEISLMSSDCMLRRAEWPVGVSSHVCLTSNPDSFKKLSEPFEFSGTPDLGASFVGEPKSVSSPLSFAASLKFFIFSVLRSGERVLTSFDAGASGSKLMPLPICKFAIFL